MVIRISISLDNASLVEYDKIVKAYDSDRSKILRKWIRENKVNDEIVDTQDSDHNELFIEE